MTTAPAQDDDGNSPQQPNIKGKRIEPINAEELKKSLSEQRILAQTSDDMLAELAEKTAELAEKITGKDEPEARTLVLNDNPNEETIKAALDADDRPADDKSHLSNPAADLIRTKLQSLYKKEPDTATEAAEAVAVKQRSKHQKFMYELTTSGKSLAEIQTEWHNYYIGLPDDEKHEVWQEFYNNQAAVSAYARHLHPQNTATPSNEKKTTYTPQPKEPFITNKPLDPRSPKQLKSQLLDTINAGGKLKPIHHVKSLLFGVGLASFVGLIMAFVFFNEVFIAPFISPSRSVSATPIIGQLSENVGPEPKIIIPKINLEVPVVYGTGTIEEQAIQDALENGVVHYPASPEPGQQGNVVIVGHSSNNILNSGKYKFAFVLLRRLENEDTFFVHKDGIRYTYKVFEKKIVVPEDVSVLGPSNRPNTITLITCDPPGTSLNRLVVVAEQISPDPAGNVAAEPIVIPTSEPAELPSNAPSLWSRLWPF
jgi:sortase A